MLPELLTLDIQRLKQVLMNIISNAIKFTFEGSITVTLTYDEESFQL